MRTKTCKFCNEIFEDKARFNNSEFCNKDCAFENSNMKRYSTSNAEYRKLITIKNCQLCDKAFNKRQDLHIDHCHSSGKIRGVLCRTCNVSLGGLGDTVESLNKAIKYLEGR